MTERLIIRNFAGLEEVDIELGRINIFIGPQASGKSVCAKCLYWLKAFLPDLLDSSRSGDDKRTFDTTCINTFKEYFPGVWRTDKHLLIRYEIADYFIQLENINGKLKLNYSPFFIEIAKINRQELLAASKAGYRSTSYQWESSRSVQAMDAIRDEVGDAADLKQSFILAGRSFFSALKGATLTFLAQAPVVDPFLRQFLSLYELTRRYFLNNNISSNKDLSSLSAHIIKGKIEMRGEEDFIISPNGRRSPLAYASSGQQEAFALLLILLYIGMEGESLEKQAIYIEEPEVHLYPDSQWAIVQLMASVYHESVFSLQYVITTHSPYLLSAFNNLIRAHQLAEQFKNSPEQLKALYHIIPKNQQLDLNDFRVYALADGKARSIISAEDGLIVAEKLDEVSERISQQFDKLLHLEAQAAADEKAS